MVLGTDVGFSGILCSRMHRQSDRWQIGMHRKSDRWQIGMKTSLTNHSLLMNNDFIAYLPGTRVD